MADVITSATNAKKLDEILKRLEGQPSIEDWHNMATVLSEVSNTVKNIGEKVCKHEEVLNGNGKPGLKMDVSKLQDGMNAITRGLWIVVGAILTTAVGAFIYLASTHALP